jgi:hypothetical protein
MDSLYALEQVKIDKEGGNVDYEDLDTITINIPCCHRCQQMKLILTSIIRLFPSILDYDFIDKIVEG